MTLKEAKMTIYANVVYACEEAGFSPMTIKMVKDACDTVIELAEQADTPQTDCNGCKFVGWYDTDFPCVNCIRKNKDYYSPEQTDCAWK